MNIFRKTNQRIDKSKLLTFKNSPYQIYQIYQPAGDQPSAIYRLIENVKRGINFQILLGVTGSGKTYTIANVIATLGRPAIIFTPNKTLGAQLYSEFRDFFPYNAVEYFVSYYDYYQPEAYIPQKDLFIEKDSSINSHIEQMRLSATKSLLERRDVIIVATVSAIYGIGNPLEYHKMVLTLRVRDRLEWGNLISRLIEMQYNRNETDFGRGCFRVRGDRIDVFPAESSETAVRIELCDDQIDSIELFDPLNGRTRKKILRFTIYPCSHYVMPRQTILNAVDAINLELQERLEYFSRNKCLIEAHRLKQRTQFDIEMLKELGFTKGIENYSRHLSGTLPGHPPSTLIDYLPEDSIMFFDESHVLIPQFQGMYNSDRSRKEKLVQYGFRLPSALDNRPLKFEEFEQRMHQTIFVSATPGKYEQCISEISIVEQVVRPTGLLDPTVEVKPASNQIDDVLNEINIRILRNERVLITVLTKRMAENLTEFLSDHDIKVRYLHSDIDTIERVEIIRDLRLGIFDVLVGINLLREGLDIPEVSLVAILDADKEGFLRAERSLIQTIGRVARNVNGHAILYADRITIAMHKSIEETKRRRDKQQAYNIEHAIIPTTVTKNIKDMIEGLHDIEDEKGEILDKGVNYNEMDQRELMHEIKQLEKQMHFDACNLEFEKAAQVRDILNKLLDIYSTK